MPDTEMTVDFGQSTIDDSIIKRIFSKEKTVAVTYKKTSCRARRFCAEYV